MGNCEAACGQVADDFNAKMNVSEQYILPK